jgi:putative FmdB family regulatory protein
MAFYDLICETCGTSFEVFRQGFLRDDDRVCPECGSVDVQQKFTSFLSGVGSGSGWGGGSGGGCSAPSGSPFG